MNISSMFVTLAVLKFERSSDSRAPHLQNIHSIVVTLAVLKFETLSDVRPLQP